MKYINKILVKIIAVVLTSIIVYLVSTLIFGHCIACDQNQIYGIWGYADSVQSIRLEIREDNKVFYHRWYNQEIDSINGEVHMERTYHTSSVSHDSLIMVDCDKKFSVAIISECTDSTLTLEHFEGIQYPMCFHRINSDVRLYDWFMPEDSLDYIIEQEYSKEIFKYYDDFKEGYQLSQKQMTQVLKLMRHCADKDSVSFECRVKDLYPMNWYIRQYASYINNDGHIMVKVSMTLNIKSEWEECVVKHYTPGIFGYLNSEYIRDGGCDYAEAIIDLTTKKVLYFKTHGSA